MEEISKWRKEMGFDFITSPEKDPLRLALEISAKTLVTLSPQELDEILLILTAHLVYLQSQAGIIAARVDYLEDEVLAKATDLMEAMRFTTLPERKAKVLEQGIGKAFILEKSKLTMLKPIVDGLKIRIDSIKKIIDRRIRESFVRS